MKKYLLSCFSILIFKIVVAQNFYTDTTAEVVSYWKMGDVRQYEISNTREKYVNNALVYKTTSTSIVDMKIAEELPGMFTIHWFYKEVNVSESEEEIAKRLADLGKGLTVKYQASETGMFEKISNPVEIQTHFINGMNTMKETYGVDTVGKSIYQILKQIFANVNSIEAAVNKEIQLYHFPYGAEYELNKISEEEITLADPYLGKSFTTRIQFKMNALDTVKKTCNISGTMNITEEEAKAMIKEFVKVANEKNPSQPIVEAQIPVTTINDVYNHLIDLNTGWLLQARYERTTANNVVKQVDYTTIKWLSPVEPDPKVKKYKPY